MPMSTTAKARRACCVPRGTGKARLDGGHYLQIDTRWSAADADRMRSHVTELLQSKLAVIPANGTPVMAALLPETCIPIIFA